MLHSPHAVKTVLHSPHAEVKSMLHSSHAVETVPVEDSARTVLSALFPPLTMLCRTVKLISIAWEGYPSLLLALSLTLNSQCLSLLTSVLQW